MAVLGLGRVWADVDVSTADVGCRSPWPCLWSAAWSQPKTISLFKLAANERIEIEVRITGKLARRVTKVSNKSFLLMRGSSVQQSSPCCWVLHKGQPSMSPSRDGGPRQSANS